MASICVHRASRTPLDSTPGHIRSRDDLPEESRPATDLPRTAMQALHSPFLQFTRHGNRLSTRLQGTLTRAMASICVHRASRTPLDSTPGHIRSHDGLQEDHRPATHSRAGTASPFPAIHQARQSPFYGPAGHIDSRDGINLCPSSVANPSR